MFQPMIEEPSHSRIRPLRAALASWLRKSRRTVAWGTEELARLANDLNLSVDDLHDLARSRPDAADQLTKLLGALRVDPEALYVRDPASMRDMQRLCVMCGHKARCRRDLATGTAAERYRDYCPNVFTLDLLLKELPTRN
jgi:hypothetical protein